MAIGAILGGLGLIGGLLSKGAGGAATGRRTDSQIQAQVDQLKAMQAAHQFTAGLQGARYGVDEQVRGIRQPSILRNLGLSPQAVARYDPNFLTSDLGKIIAQRMMEPGPQLNPYQKQSPTVLKQPGRWESVLGGLGAGLGLLGGGIQAYQGLGGAGAKGSLAGKIGSEGLGSKSALSTLGQPGLLSSFQTVEPYKAISSGVPFTSGFSKR